ncbi:hypothetical protein ES319_D02G067300v1 [Gossypium barbadense]|uniref:CG-1 domain-containing protein n=1 Tax=Gossypium barbadense TaxID=3634 RepID=A0A5J5S954_GOSBA|nr:hypothetical protein ES319_D02G067300v1 [Gossypium barbadense]
MEDGGCARLVGAEIHGFHTLQDLDVKNMMEEAKSRWLRPNEIHAILCNHRYFSIQAKPVNMPKSGTIVLFDRKMLRNFRKDGYNWKKKKDGKTIKEAHEHLKVGDKERIHVYYAHGEDNSTFVRRCYWLLDKSLEQIVLVHYRETKEVSLATHSNSSSLTDQSTPLLVTEEFDSGIANTYSEEPGESVNVRNHEMKLLEINTLEWDELLVANGANDSIASRGDNVSCFDQQNQMAVNDFSNYILVTGVFHQAYQHLAKSTLFCVCGDLCTPAEIVQVGVYRCLLSQHSPGLVNLYMSLDGHKPISQVLGFEYFTPLSHDPIFPTEDESRQEEFQLQMRLAYLLFSTSKSLDILLGNKVSPNILKGVKKFAQKTTNMSDCWKYLMKSFEENRVSSTQAKDSLLEIALKNRLRDWLLERIIEGGKTNEHDTQGQGVLHLCAILGYTWAMYLYSWSGLSLDFRDKHGWTALHWAAFYGREKMVAVLLSAGAKPNLVTDPTTRNPNGYTAADLASLKGYEGLAAYLSEEALVAHFNDMAVAGNASGSLQTSRTEATNFENLNEVNYI